jgi:perosamine synthetase
MDQILKAGCLSREQTTALYEELSLSADNPSILSDLEGCGPVARLEEAFANLCGTHYALALSSGTAAIHAALLAAGVGPGDEVIVSPYSWSQSVSPVLFTGATPIFADIDEGTLNLHPDSVRHCITGKTRAIIVVHLFGHMADMTNLQRISHEAGALLITDAAHAIGAYLWNKPAGFWGGISCFSLGRGKLVCGGEGGILTTNNPDLYERAVCLTQHKERVKRLKPASCRKDTFALNYRLHPIAALLALTDLQSLNEKLNHRRRIYQAFWEGLGKQGILSPQKTICGEIPSYYGIPLTADHTIHREALVATSHDAGIPLRCGPVRMPLHLRLHDAVSPQHSFHPSHLKGSCPAAEDRCLKKELLALSALDMDGMAVEVTALMGEKLARILMSNHIMSA